MKQSELAIKRAVETLDHFPSIAQLAEIAEYLRQHSPDWSEKHAKAMPVEQYERRSPWPPAIEGLLLGFEDKRGPSPTGLNKNRISADEARYLYDCMRNQDFTNQWALEIIAKSNAKNVFNTGTAP